MKKLHPSAQFKKDYKRYRHDSQKKEALKEVLDLLVNEQPIPQKYKPHTLKGDYKGCMECHIENYYLLVWIDNTHNVIELVRLGSHSELFG